MLNWIFLVENFLFWVSTWNTKFFEIIQKWEELYKLPVSSFRELIKKIHMSTSTATSIPCNIKIILHGKLWASTWSFVYVTVLSHYLNFCEHLPKSFCIIWIIVILICKHTIDFYHFSCCVVILLHLLI